MTVTARKRPPLSKRDWWKNIEPFREGEGPLHTIEEMQPRLSVQAWLEKHPPVMPQVQCTPVEQVRDQMSRDVDALVPDRTKERTEAMVSASRLKATQHERDIYRERFILMLVAFIGLLILSGWGGCNQMQRIRVYETASEGSHVTVSPFSSPHLDTEPGSYSNEGSPNPAPTRGDIDGD